MKKYNEILKESADDILQESISLIENRMKREIEKGNVSQSNIERAKKAGGILKTLPQYSKGIALGNRNLDKINKIKNSRTPIINKNLANQSKEVSKTISPETHKTISKVMPAATARIRGKHYNYVSKIKDKPLQNIVKRHEVDEVRSINRVVKNLPKKDRGHIAIAAAGASSGAPGHMSPDVLKKEKRHLNMASSLGSKGAEELKKFRQNTGEDQLTNLSNKDIKKIHKTQDIAVKNQIETMKKTNIDHDTQKNLRSQIRSVFTKKFADKAIGNSDKLFGKGKGKS